MAMSSVTDDLGRGLGPVLVAALISRLGSRRAAFNAALLGFFPCALMQAALALTIRRDEAAVQARLAARAKRMTRDVERSATGGGGGGGAVGLQPAASLQLGGRVGSGSSGGGGGKARRASTGGGGFAMREVLVRRHHTHQEGDALPSAAAGVGLVSGSPPVSPTAAAVAVAPAPSCARLRRRGGGAGDSMDAAGADAAAGAASREALMLATQGEEI